MTTPDDQSLTGIRGWLSNAQAPIFGLYAVFAAFSTYFCMYAFRKPFSAASYTGQGFVFGEKELQMKTALVISQIVGYFLSKVIGTKLCSEAKPESRIRWLMGLILAAEAALLLFAVVPPPLKLVAIFLNGLPLGMVWGMVVLYLEGRRTSEILLAGLSCAFIVASGVVKAIGKMLLNNGISEFWMPCAVGAIFLVPFFISAWLLNQIPQPSLADQAERTERKPMSKAERWAFFRQFRAGLVMLLLAYFFVTAYRDYRDNYMPDILTGLGYDKGSVATLLATTELWVGFGVMGTLSLLFLVRNNRWGFIGAYSIMIFGCLLLGGGTWMFRKGMIGGEAWIIATGLGGYLTYVPFGSVLFDRLIAATNVVATAVYAIYIADATGYLGSIFVQVYKDFYVSGSTRVDFFVQFNYFMTITGALLLGVSLVYFLGKIGGSRKSP
ncbi:MAG: hypothetical protein KDN22_27225 [Verrucomicrobiae bacterium]|nr:hypothetical protein [Verrucomicrobiae bacterium]